MKTDILLLLFITVAALFLMPELTAKFAGSHTMEVNASGGVEGLRCTRCHQYVLDELIANDASTGTYAKHRIAAGNSTYTQGWLNLTIDNETEFGVCQMCHLSQIADIATHTKAVVRACIDVDCHGTNETTNNTYYAVGNMSPLLAAKNVHESVFDTFSGIETTYLNETGGNYSRGFFFCLACHTEVQASLAYPEGEIEYFTHNNPTASRRRYL